MNNVGRGGKRPGAGRKPKWNCETVTMRVPKALVGEIQAFIERRMTVPAMQEAPPAPELLELWHDEKRCQAATTKGTRCRLPMAIVYKLQHAGRSIEIGICQRHHDQIRQGVDQQAHPSVLESVTKSSA
jgi:hypothetical protein